MKYYCSKNFIQNYIITGKSRSSWQVNRLGKFDQYQANREIQWQAKFMTCPSTRQEYKLGFRQLAIYHC